MEPKTVLILGASGGIGQALVTLFLSQTNHNLALHFYENKLKLENSDRTLAHKADLCIEPEVELLVAKTLERFGRIDMVINSAGVSLNGMSWKTSLENWQQTLNVNLTVPFLITKHVLPSMRENNFGRIVYLSSIVAQTGVVGASAYAASKSGLFGLTRTISKEVANKDITANAIALGYFNTGMINDVPKKIKDQIVADIPLNRLGDPKELFQLLLFILHEKSSYFTGQIIGLNGGLHN